MRFALIFGISCLLQPGLTAATLDEVEASAKRDLKDALARLAKQRNEHQLEKTPMAREAISLEESARSKRKEFDRRLRLRDNQESSLAELEDEVEEIEGDLEAALSLLSEYNRSWFDGLSSPERELRREPVKKILFSDSEKDPDDESWGEISPQFDLAKMSADRLKQSYGGIRFTGRAVTPNDDVEELGDFLSLGPATYFASSESNASGVVEFSRRSEVSNGVSLDPASLSRSRSSRVLQTPDKIAETIRGAVTQKKGGSITLPLDPTLGKAIVLASSEPTLVEELAKGGVWIFPILGFALLSTLIALCKAWQILSVRHPSGQPDLEGKYGMPFMALPKAARANLGKSAEILEEVLYEQIIEAQARLEKWLPVVAVTAAAAPLLGLLGTVTGMIDVFQQLTHFANPENSELSRGISEALVTTKFGLITAIPALIVHALLSRRVQGIIAKMESFASGFVNLAANGKKEIATETTANESGD